MAKTSYPDKSNTRGVWKLKDITRNKLTDGTWIGSAQDRSIQSMGLISPASINTMEYVSISTLGDSVDFGDLSQARHAGGCVGNSIRGIFVGGMVQPSNPGVNTMDYVHAASLGNAADFGDLTETGWLVNGHANDTKGRVAGFRAVNASTGSINDLTIATTGNAVDFSNLSDARFGTGAAGSSTRAIFFGGYTVPAGSKNVIDFQDMASGGNAIDFGDLTTARNDCSAVSSTTRGVAAGGGSNVIDYITISGLGNATDFGDLVRAKGGMGEGSNNTRGIFSAGTEPDDTLRAEIDYITISSTGDAADFGDMTSNRFNVTGWGTRHGGLDEFSTRAPEQYSPTGRPIVFGDEVGLGDVGLFMSGGYGYVKTIDYVSISSAGNGVDFGDTATSGSHMGGAGSSTRAFVAGYSGPIANNIDYGLFATKGNHADFGNLTVARDKIGSLSNNTRACFLGGRGSSSSPESLQNVIDYITMATIGNASDFGDLAAATQVPMGVANNTRGVLGGGKTPSYLNVIQYITIGSTGNASDFGDLSVARGPGGGTGVSSSTRGVYAGGEISGANSNVMDYITIASAGNASDFGDLEFVTGWASGLDNATRGVFSGFNNTSATGADTTFGNCPQISYITIASTGNYTDFGDLTARRYGLAAASNGHGALS